MSTANVVTLHPLEEAEALSWLRGQPDHTIETSVAELARQFGWRPAKLRRRLDTWAKAGQVVKTAVSRNKVQIAVSPKNATAGEVERKAKGAASGGEAPADPWRSPAAARQAAARMIERAFQSVSPEIVVKPRRSILALAAATLLFATALGLAGVGLFMNARFAASFGQTTEAAVLLAMIGLAIDVLAVTLPTVAAQLWHHGSRANAALAWCIWVVALGMTLLAAMGFASTNIGDAVAGRAKLAGEQSALAERLARTRVERGAITELRSVGAIDAELQRAQAAMLSVWSATSGCHDVTLPSSRRACEPVFQLREALATAQRRDLLDGLLRADEVRLAAIPAIATSDPQANTAAEVMAWVSNGNLNPSARDIYWVRTMGLTITPSLAGLIAMLALTLARARRRN
jgi:hypothetical protein